MTTIITGTAQIQRARLVTLRAALRLEIVGLRRRGLSAYAILKHELNLPRASRQEVLDAINLTLSNALE
jgi:hypothetical protein